jgi:serine/threonine protein phosphatase PrpC
MTENPLPLETAFVTDRGLNERRPHNEDYYLADPSRGLFVVADGVGGAEAGEVASQTTVEVIDEAFRHRRDDDDVEDLLEIAIQRANDSVYRQSREQPRLSMMATTVVALHLEGLRATVGHVGDSRLYRLTPAGEIVRETEDHSVVEEEVRAGRMTAAQAANHPSRNVISRAVGAEPAVEADMKKIEFEPGTVFLLCSDGVTRHVPDEELAAVINQAETLESACEELKRLCFERGAEDNLTAVLVRVGARAAARPEAFASSAADEEVTLIQERNGAAHAASAPGASAEAAAILRRPFDDAGREASRPSHALRTPDGGDARASYGVAESTNQTVSRRTGGAALALGVVALLAVSAAAAFLGGRLYERRNPREGVAPAIGVAAPNAPTNQDISAEGAGAQSFEKKKRAVDLAPRAEAERMLAESDNNPLASSDPEFLYLYGRAMLLEDRQQEAAQAFERAIQQASNNMTPENGQLKIDARLAKIAAHLRAGDAEGARAAADALSDVLRAARPQTDPGGNAPPAPGVTP